MVNYSNLRSGYLNQNILRHVSRVFWLELCFVSLEHLCSWKIPHITADRIVATLVSFVLQMFKERLGAAPMARRFTAILPQQFDQALNKFFSALLLTEYHQIVTCKR
jgi:hypothetical protein